MAEEKHLFSKILLTSAVCTFLFGVFLLASTYYFVGYSVANSYLLILVTLLAIVIFFSLCLFLIWLDLRPLKYLYNQIKSGQLANKTQPLQVHSTDEIGFITEYIDRLTNKTLQPKVQTATTPGNLIVPVEEMRHTLSSLSDGVAILDSASKIIFSNPVFEKLTHFSMSEIVNKPVDTVLRFQDQTGHLTNFETLYSTIFVNLDGNVHSGQAINIIGKGDVKSQVSISIHKLASNPTAPIYFLILHNLTEEKIFQQMQIDFVSMASHEFRTPLTSIINYLSVLNEEARSKLDPSQQQLLDRASASAQQLSSLVGNILNVAKIERGSLTVALEIVDWKKLVLDVVQDNKTEALHKNITLETKIPENDLPKIKADPIRIKEVLNNLITNAITYTREGGKIEVGVQLTDHQILTYVKDNGIGISKEAIPHLFTKFYRAPGALAQMYKGNGLGLYLAKSIIDLHHGKIWVESQAGNGSTFFFTLPTEEAFSQTPTIVELNKYSNIH
ncbi:ATP-binding protein [Patescibacteria group bacterium]|nr:ATP-binding protein [Patescibacteria group bacterium]